MAISFVLIQKLCLFEFYFHVVKICWIYLLVKLDHICIERWVLSMRQKIRNFILSRFQNVFFWPHFWWFFDPRDFLTLLPVAPYLNPCFLFKCACMNRTNFICFKIQNRLYFRLIQHFIDMKFHFKNMSNFTN